MAFGGENAESYYDEGLTAFIKGDVDAALGFLKRALELDPDLLAARHQLGRCYLRLGQPGLAVDYLQQVLTRRPDLVPARLDLGTALLQQGRADESRRQFSQVLTLQAQNARAQLGLAQAAFQEGNWPSAVALAQTARGQGAASFAVLLLLGRAAKLAGNEPVAQDALKEAEGLIEKSVEMSPDQPEGYFLRGEVYFTLERFSSAMEQYRAAQDRAESGRHYAAFGESFTLADLIVKRGLCMQRLGNLEGARELGRQAFALAPHNKLAQALAEL